MHPIAHALELRPLTLLFGCNNAGKSALLRALPLLSASARSRGQQALDLTSPATKHANFDEIRCAFPSEERPRKLGLGLRWPSGRSISCLPIDERSNVWPLRWPNRD